jgi:hypothetical protein
MFECRNGSKEEGDKMKEIAKLILTLRKASSAVYLAVEESVANDLSKMLSDSALHLSDLSEKVKELEIKNDNLQVTNSQNADGLKIAME